MNDNPLEPFESIPCREYRQVLDRRETAARTLPAQSGRLQASQAPVAPIAADAGNAPPLLEPRPTVDLGHLARDETGGFRDQE